MTSNPVFRASLVWGSVVTAVIAVVGGIVGLFVDGSRGLVSALLGAVVALVFLSVTAVSILLANRKAGSELFVPIFFAGVMGGWLVKFVVFLVLAWAVKQQDWVNDTVFFLAVIAGVIGSLVVDGVVVAKVRVPHASDVTLPGDESRDD
ncbi:hypothetical protein [Paramicrobacterium agarici]|uniref:ATP synthase protein I n=1 Tax=Paramicrobacterium agarici TaxID=630514 RepID=A0A2A9DX60_9MICO|nr:hypothetical protein [Microbacterium agarici]PFG30931.1 hypothetical protein ATJ78_1876 [Microbacterium agarici]TQO23995.1 hypothetical protein FB385_2865 [Microbacterium agarici]